MKSRHSVNAAFLLLQSDKKGSMIDTVILLGGVEYGRKAENQPKNIGISGTGGG